MTTEDEDTEQPLVELGRVTIRYGIDPDLDESVVRVGRQGDAENYLVALGLLAAATDSVNNPPDEDD